MSFAQAPELTVTGWQMQDVAKVSAAPETVSSAGYKPEGWYAATVPGTVLTTLVNNKVYPEPLYGENMRSIPESLNKTSYWYRSSFTAPRAEKGGYTWLHFAGVNYSAEVWVNGHHAGMMKGAFLRGDFNITAFIKPGKKVTLAVLVAPQPHPGTPHEHTVALGIGKNGGDTALDGPTFLSTIGWDWLPAVRDRDTGIWLPVRVSTTGPVILNDPFVTSSLADSHAIADLTVSAAVKNVSPKAVAGTLVGTITGGPTELTFSKPMTLGANAVETLSLDSAAVPQLHLTDPKLWWPNGYGPQNLYHLALRFEAGKSASETKVVQFGIRKIAYQVADSENLTISVNGVKIMVRGGNWGLDEGMKRIPRERLDAQFHMHALANMNLIRNWVGQSTGPDFYDLADRYGILLWDEFFQPNPSDGPDVTDLNTYLANVTDKVVRYRNHPAIAVWCARNEGYPPKELDDQLKALMAKLDPSRLYQSNSADGRGVSSHGPYFWRSPRYFYSYNESFKTEVGSVSVPTIESIQGMMPQKDWETINDDWAQHDMARGAQRGDEYPANLAKRYGPVRNLADFVRKAQLANYETFRAMYEGRNAKMFTATTGIITWMSHPAQPSFVWQLYHYDLEPNASLFAVKKASEHIHAQLNEATGRLEVVNNSPEPVANATLKVSLYNLEGKLVSEKSYPVASVPGSTTADVSLIDVPANISAVYFAHLQLAGSDGAPLSTNFYWQNVAQDDFTSLEKLPSANVQVQASSQVDGENTVITAAVHNTSQAVALMTHLQIHRKTSGERVLPAFYSENYLSLTPDASQTVTITVPTRSLQGEQPLLLVDGFNVHCEPAEGSVSVAPNLNADPSHSPASNIVPHP